MYQGKLIQIYVLYVGPVQEIFKKKETFLIVLFSVALSLYIYDVQWVL